MKLVKFNHEHIGKAKQIAMSKPKFSPDIKIRACEEYLSGNGSIYLSIW